jgi:hypothetical protein
MQYLIVAGIQRNVTDHTVLSTKQHQVAGAQVRDARGNRTTSMRHLTRGARKSDSMLPIHVLNKA